jgi:hypothetical protein
VACRVVQGPDANKQNTFSSSSSLDLALNMSHDNQQRNYAYDEVIVYGDTDFVLPIVVDGKVVIIDSPDGYSCREDAYFIWDDATDQYTRVARKRSEPKLLVPNQKDWELYLEELDMSTYTTQTNGSTLHLSNLFDDLDVDD